MTRATVLVALLPLLIGACGGAPGETGRTVDVAQDKQQVEAAGQRIWGALSRNDATAIVAEYAEDAIIFPPNAPMVQGKPAVTAFLGSLLGAIMFRDVAGTIADIRISGDLAVETGHYAWTLVPAGGAAMPAPMPDRGNYVHVWARSSDGKWKVIRYFSNSDVAVPAP